MPNRSRSAITARLALRGKRSFAPLGLPAGLPDWPLGKGPAAVFHCTRGQPLDLPHVRAAATFARHATAASHRTSQPPHHRVHSARTRSGGRVATGEAMALAATARLARVDYTARGASLEDARAPRGGPACVRPAPSADPASAHPAAPRRRSDRRGPQARCHPSAGCRMSTIAGNRSESRRTDADVTLRV